MFGMPEYIIQIGNRNLKCKMLNPVASILFNKTDKFTPLKNIKITKVMK